MKMIRYQMSLAVMVWAVTAFAASDNDSALIHRLEVEAAPGYVLHTNRFLEGNNPEVRTMNHSFVAKLKYAFMPPQGSEQARIYKGSYQGVGLALHDFNKQLGHPVSAYLFQGATIATLAPRLTFNYEWDFGVTYGWKSYDKDARPENHVIGSKMTAYINANFYLRYMLSDHWDLTLGGAFTHYSNGNTSIPNAGLNSAEPRFSLAYYINRELSEEPDAPLPVFQRDFHADVTLFGAWKQKGVDTSDGAYPMPGTFGVAGFTVNPLWGLNHWLNVGASLDVQYDHSSNIDIDNKALTETYWNGTEEDIHIPAWYKQVSAGMSARVEFMMPYFRINFGIGHNFLNAGAQNFKGFYEMLALKIAMSKKVYLHIGYSLYDFYYPNNLMLGFGYRFPLKKQK